MSRQTDFMDVIALTLALFILVCLTTSAYGQSTLHLLWQNISTPAYVDEETQAPLHPPTTQVQR